MGLFVRYFVLHGGAENQNPFVWILHEGLAGLILIPIMWFVEPLYLPTSLADLIPKSLVLALFVTAGSLCMNATADYIPAGISISIRVLEIPICFFLGAFVFRDQEFTPGRALAHLSILALSIIANVLYNCPKKKEESPTPSNKEETN